MKSWRQRATWCVALAIIMSALLMPLEGAASQKLERGDPDVPIDGRNGAAPKKLVVTVVLPTTAGTPLLMRFSLPHYLFRWLAGRTQ
jgi:hypothetical protein